MEVCPDGQELLWRRTFPGVASQAKAAREFVAFLLAGFPNLDDAVLVTGELVANVLRHTASAHPGGEFLLEVRRRTSVAVVAVTDEGSQKVPIIPELSDLSECGRGLYTAEALATKLSWMGDNRGRTVVATFKQ